MSESIREKGVIQPLLVIRAKGGQYTLIAGERRLRAARLAGLEEVPVLLTDDGGDSESLELALIENLQRHDLNPIEEATAYARLMEEFQLTQEEVARKVGQQRSTIANTLRLLQLPLSLQEDVVQSRISEGHARVLLRLKEHPERLLEIRNRIVAEGLSVRTAERLCQQQRPRPSREDQATPQTNAQVESELSPAYCASLVNQLTNRLNARVRLVQQGQRGRLEIEYYSSADLDRLVGLLTP